jgi:hypothetical protein
MTGVLNYNPLLMAWEIRPLLPELTEENKTKVCYIEDLNKIQVALSGEPLSESQFDKFMNSSVQELHDYCMDQSNVLYRVKQLS